MAFLSRFVLAIDCSSIAKVLSMAVTSNVRDIQVFWNIPLKARAYGIPITPLGAYQSQVIRLHLPIPHSCRVHLFQIFMGDITRCIT